MAQDSRALALPAHVPVRKVGAAGLSGSVATIAIWALDHMGIKPDASVAAALTTLISFAVAYFVPSPAGGAATDD